MEPIYLYIDARAEGEKNKNLLGGTFTVLNKNLVSRHATRTVFGFAVRMPRNENAEE